MHVKRIDVNYIGEVSRIINFRRIKREAKMMSYDIPFEIEYGGFYICACVDLVVFIA